jgi:hypothetical protein
MKRIIVLLLWIALVAPESGTANSITNSTNGTEKDSVIRISIGGGMVFSTVNVGLEPIGEVKKGINARMGVKFRRRLGITAEYTNHLIHDASPAWAGIKSQNFDLNLNYLYLNVSQTSTKFYGIIGVCFQQWSGVYQGTPVYGKDVYDYQQGQLIKFNWPSLNTGIGFERMYKYGGAFGEFKFRFGQDQVYDPIGIVDVCITVGVKLNLVSIGSRSKPPTSTKNRNYRMKLKPKIYRWF